jgi:hypothetical protein
MVSTYIYTAIKKNTPNRMASTSAKISATIQSIFVFLIISSPFTYKLTNGLLGGIIGKLADTSGCPTTLGLLVHSLVFGLIVWGLMHI